MSRRRRPPRLVWAAALVAVACGAAPRASAQPEAAITAPSSTPPDVASAAPDESTSDAAPSADGPLFVPDLTRILPRATDRQSLSNSVQILVLLTVLTVLPSIVLMMTCFVRMLVVLALLRQALGTQQLPPSQVVVGLALFLTILVMAPTWERIHSEAIQPYLEARPLPGGGTFGQMEALSTAGGILREFMFKQIRAAGNETDVYLMYEYAAQRAVPPTETLDERAVPLTAVIPAFILSELKAAFVLGFRIYLPFLVIDLVISTVLVAMGMMMLPPVLISLPFKLLLFVLVDGWHLVAGALMASVR